MPLPLWAAAQALHARVDVAINAVIVSAAQSPWDAIRRAPGVRNVIVTGGIIALGKTPIPGEIPGGGPQPAWLRLIPDLRLLNGSAIPPVVPNVIDVRIMDCPIPGLKIKILDARVSFEDSVMKSTALSLLTT